MWINTQLVNQEKSFWKICPQAHKSEITKVNIKIKSSCFTCIAQHLVSYTNRILSSIVCRHNHNAEFVLVPVRQGRTSEILILLFTRLYLDCRLTWAELDADSVCQAICREHWNFSYCFRLLLLSVFFSQSNFSPENSSVCVRWIWRRKRENKHSIRFLDYHKVLSYCSVRVCLCNCFVVFFCIFVHKLN